MYLSHDNRAFQQKTILICFLFGTCFLEGRNEEFSYRALAWYGGILVMQQKD